MSEDTGLHLSVLCIAYDGLSSVLMSICLLATVVGMGSIWIVEGRLTMDIGLLTAVV